MTQKQEIVKHDVEFGGDTIEVFEKEGKKWVAMKGLCESMGLDWEAQRKLINRDPVLSSTTSIMEVVAKDGKKREVVSMDYKYLNGWLFKIHANNYEGERYEIIIEYQKHCYHVLHGHFHPQGLDMDAEKELERQVKSVGNILKAQDHAEKAVKKILKGIASIEDYEGRPEIMKFVKRYLAMEDERKRNKFKDDPFEQWWFECLCKGVNTIENGQGVWAPSLSVSSLYNHYLDFMDTYHNGIPAMDKSRFGNKLRKVAPGCERQRQKSSRGRQWCYKLGTLERCRAAFESRLGVEMNWDNALTIT